MYRQFFIIALLLGMNVATDAQTVATIQPANPKHAEQIVVSYDPTAPGAVHKDASEVYAVVLMMYEEGIPSVREQKMERTGGRFTASFVIDDITIVGAAVRFDSDKATDDNHGAGWKMMMIGKNNKPVKGAEYIQWFLHLQKNYYGFKFRQDSVQALEALRRERAMYPDNWIAQVNLWLADNRSNPGKRTTARIVKELDAVYAKLKKNEKAVNALLPIFFLTDQSKKAESIEASWITKNPNGIIAESKAQQNIMKETDQAKRAGLAAEYLDRFTVMKGSEALYLSAFIRVKDYQKAAAFLKKYPDVHPNYYNSVGYGLISKGEDIENGVAVVKEGLDRISGGDLRMRLDDLRQSRASWKENRAYQRGMIADSYGEGLMKLGKYAEAEPVMEESNMLMQQDDPDNNTRLAECYAKNGKHEKVTALSFTSLVKGRGTSQLLELYKTSYTAVKGSAAGFDSVVNAANDQMKNDLRAKLKKEKLDKPSIDFELKYLDGTTVKLSDLKGKVVVLDFWATWCGPCISSFPSLQKIYDRYKNNPDVKILAMNTWERVPPAEREQHVKNFIEKNNYTFPVVFDTDLVQRYGVSGIPTKFIIDKEGIIRFKDVGFGGAQEMEQKMELQFEMLITETASK
jgi:thiol-disulfide isomerase/thioredoxin